MVYNISFLGFLNVYICILLLFNVCASETVNKNDDGGDEDLTEDAKGENMEIFVDTENSNYTACARRKNSQVHEIRKASINQFPFMAAIMSSRNEYVCAGSIVSNGIILTTAKCSESASYVLINTTNDKTTHNTLRIIKTEKFPTFTGNNLLKDIALLYTEKMNTTMATKIFISNYTSYKTLSDIEALGFGLNAEDGKIKELQYVGLLSIPVVHHAEEKIEAIIDCIDTKVLTCFKDKGGPVIFNDELVGLIVLGQDKCTKEITSTYAVNKLMLTAIPTYTFKAWLDEKIAKNIEKTDERLEIFPKKPIVRKAGVHVMTSKGAFKDRLQLIFLMLLGSFNYYSGIFVLF